MSLDTTLETIRAALASHFADNWVDGEDAALTEIKWPNTAEDIPDGESWVRYTLLFADTMRAIITGDRTTGHVTDGQVVLQLFSPLGTGDAEIIELAGKARSVMTEQTVASNLTTKIASIQMIGAANGFLQVNVSTPFEYLEI